MPKSVTRLHVGLGMSMAGVLLLLFTTGMLPTGTLLWPTVTIVVGCYLLWRAFWADGREANVFAGTFLLLTGVFLLLRTSALAQVTLQRLWPVFMSIGGLALLAYGISKGRDYRLVLGVPAAAIILLSVVFLLFSLEVVTISFTEFVLRWWPGLVVFWGITTVWSYFERRRTMGDIDEHVESPLLMPPDHIEDVDNLDQ